MHKEGEGEEGRWQQAMMNYQKENITDVLLREYGIIVLIAIVQSVKVARWGSWESRQAHKGDSYLRTPIPSWGMSGCFPPQSPEKPGDRRFKRS